jgi:hypothetical protein
LCSATCRQQQQARKKKENFCFHNCLFVELLNCWIVYLFNWCQRSYFIPLLRFWDCFALIILFPQTNTHQNNPSFRTMST